MAAKKMFTNGTHAMPMDAAVTVAQSLLAAAPSPTDSNGKHRSHAEAAGESTETDSAEESEVDESRKISDLAAAEAPLASSAVPSESSAAQTLDAVDTSVAPSATSAAGIDQTTSRVEDDPFVQQLLARLCDNSDMSQAPPARRADLRNGLLKTLQLNFDAKSASGDPADVNKHNRQTVDRVVQWAKQYFTNSTVEQEWDSVLRQRVMNELSDISIECAAAKPAGL